MEVAASIIGVVQLADRVLSLCGNYLQSVRSAKDDINRVSAEVGTLKSVLERADQMVNDEIMKDYMPDSLRQELGTIITSCQLTLEDLESKLESKLDHNQKGSSIRGLLHVSSTLKWPFKSKEVMNIIQELDRHKGTITLTLQLDRSETLYTYLLPTHLLTWYLVGQT